MTKVSLLFINLTLFSFSVSCGLMESLDTTNQNTTDMNKDMGEMVKDVDDMDLRTEEMNNSMNDMMSTMDEMNQTMEKMNQTMDDMSKSMEEMKGNISKLGTDARQGISLGIRTQAWDRLVESADVDAKLAAASAYHMAFEYQTWKGSGLDSNSRRHSLFYDGLAEYYRNIYGFADRNNWSLNVTSKKNEMNVLFALAGTLEKVNSNQQLFLSEDENLVSFLTLFKEAVIGYKVVNEAGYDISQLPEYLEETAEFKQLTVYMLNLRHNILSGLVVAKLSRLDKSSSRLSEIRRQGRTLMTWRPRLEEYSNNPGLIKRISHYIEEANQLRKFLCDHAEPATKGSTDVVKMKMSILLKRAINNMLIDGPVVETIQDGLENHPALAKKFLGHLKEMKASVNLTCKAK